MTPLLKRVRQSPAVQLQKPSPLKQKSMGERTPSTGSENSDCREQVTPDAVNNVANSGWGAWAS